MNLTQTHAAKHVAYERDLEPDNYGLDNCPFDTAIVWDFGTVPGGMWQTVTMSPILSARSASSDLNMHDR